MLELYRSSITDSTLTNSKLTDSTLTIEIIVTNTKSGIIVQLLGGNFPHVGATVISHPRPSIADSDQISCNTIIIPELGHKEDELAKPLSEKLAKALNVTVVLIAGIHVDDADQEMINKILNICSKLVEGYLAFACKGV